MELNKGGIFIMGKYIIDVQGKCMSTKEYLEKIKDSQFDKEFDEAIRLATQQKAELEAKKEHEQEFVKLTTKLNDIECELNIAEQLYKDNIFNDDKTIKEKQEIVDHIKYLKTQYTKVKNKINSFILAEQSTN